ncbi:outer membrane protein assembly factor BamC [Pseudidiomarina sp.]|uniref:outer membrane protein assembly factor BamC n=1 Tax=Pseudidiomarina sp. TaxID=2081707 RepID=UPI00299EF5C1|nr:outer membrane protein assembly factor BamC [Pseudidiomarina sp.]MDX1705711.1 outer membrane protein assembly factor BamC [Pseudidiomarina sp.]
MKSFVVSLTCLSVAVIGGCSFTPQEQAEGDFSYTKTSLHDGLKPAPGLKVPEASTFYQVPPVPANKPVGKSVNIKSPTLVWATAAGSRVEETQDEVKVYFDEIEGMSNLAEFVWTGMLAELSARQIEVASEQPQQRLETGWVVHEREVGEEELRVRSERRFEFIMATPDHGRTTSLTVNMIDKQQSGPGQDFNPGLVADRNAETRLLNGVINEIAIRQNNMQGIVATGTDIDVTAGFNDDGYPALTLDTSFQNSWGLMGAVLPELGFTIDDLNQSAGNYYTTYEKGKRGLSKLAFWRDSVEGKLDIPEGEYEINVNGDRNLTTITFFFDGQPLSAAQLNRIYGPVAAEIRRQNER